MKKILLPAVLLGMSFSAVSVFAETGDVTVTAVPVMYTMTGTVTANSATTGEPVTPVISTVNPVTETTPNFAGYSLTELKARGAQLIAERIASMNANADIINASKTLSQEQKNALTGIFSTNTTGLTTLGVSIASSTDASSTRVLLKSIYTDFRIYAVIIPKVRIEKRIYDLQNHAQKLSDLFVQVQTRIDAAKAQGKNVDVWQKNLDNAKIRVATDLGILTSLFVRIDALNAASYSDPSYKAVITQANATLKTVVADFDYAQRSVRMPTSSGSTGSSTGGPNIYHPIHVGSSTTSGPNADPTGR